MKYIKIFLLLILISIISVSCYIGWKYYPDVYDAYMEASYKMRDISKDDFIRGDTTKIYDDKNIVIGELFNNKYQYVKYNDISPNVINALIATEDKNFFSHNGIDLLAIARAYKANRDAGYTVQGGSTITQQFIKNKVLSNEKSYKRKLIEAFCAIKLEKMMTKKEILELYLNNVEFGNNCVGIGTASNFYFGKSASDLSVPEAALLVGIVNNPTLYNPLKNVEGCTNRRKIVLDSLQHCGLLSSAECKEYSKEAISLNVQWHGSEHNPYMYQAAVNDAVKELMRSNGFKFKYTFSDEGDYSRYWSKYKREYKSYLSMLKAGGFRIYTTLNQDIQNIAQYALDSELSKFSGIKDANGNFEVQGAITIIDNKSGKVVAVIGGRNMMGYLNRAYQSPRQPGSTAKPIVVYAPALDNNVIKFNSILDDVKKYNGPKNWNDKYVGRCTLNTALVDSKNTCATYVFEKLTPEVGLNYLNRLQMTSLSWQDNGNLAMAIGGFTYGTTTTDIARAYSSFSREGKMIPTSTLHGVVDEVNDTKFIPDRSEKKIYSKESMEVLLPILRNVANSGTSLRRTVPTTIDIIAKTGTTNDNRDGWFVGVTPEYTVAIWVGRDDNKPINKLYGVTVPCDIYKSLIKGLYPNNVSGKFTYNSEYTPYVIPKTVIKKEQPKRVVKKEQASVPATVDIPTVNNDNNSNNSNENINTKPDWL